MSQDNIDINVYKTIEEVTIDVQPNLTVVNVNTVGGGLPVTKTSELINDGENGVDPFITLEDIPEVIIPTKTSDLTNDGEDGINPFITLEDIPPIDISTLVPYTGATTDVDLGENGISTGFVKFDTTPTDIPELQGAMFWDEDDNTVDVILNGYRMKIGEDTFYPVKNQSGSTITKGTNVKFAGTVGASGRLLILPFLANGTDPSYVYMGVAAEDIADGEDGKVLWFGRLRGLNTNAFNEGDVLYASTTSAGGFQTAIPTGANNIVQVSAVIKKSINQGVIFIRPQIEPVLFKPENIANKATNLTSPDDVKYPTTLAVSTALDTKIGVTQLTSISILAASWTLVSGLYEYNLSNANITSTSIVEAIPDNSAIDIVKAAELLPRTDSSAGSVKFYATNLPTANFTITINIYK
jgi:hypothetical protein